MFNSEPNTAFGFFGPESGEDQSKNWTPTRASVDLNQPMNVNVPFGQNNSPSPNVSRTQ